MNQLQSAAGRAACVTLIILLSYSSFAQSNDAISFDGTDDYVSTNLSVSTYTAFTVEAWINYSNTTNTTAILGQNGVLEISFNNSRLYVWMQSHNNGWVNTYYTIDASFPANTWNHFAITGDGSSLKIYINGEQKASLATSWDYLYSNANKFNMAGFTQNPFVYFNGKMDEIKVWNVARTGAEIKANMFNKNLSNSTSGMTAYYRMNDGAGTTASNSCTNTSSIDGTLTNGPTWTASPVQFAGNALKFNGSSNYVELNNRINIGSSDFTIEAWVYPQSTSAGMVLAQDVCGDAEQQFRLYTNSSKVNFDMSDAAASGAPYSFQLASTANSVPLNTWTHIAVTRSGNNYILYINGVSNATTSTGANTINNQSGADVNKRLRIGARGGVSAGCGLNYFNGIIDEVKYWSVARTGTEIQQNYIKEIDPASNANLITYYTFNQGIASGTNSGLNTLIDQAGNNNGTLTGFSLSGATSNFVTQNSGMHVLPLQWLSFTVQRKNENVLLQWRTVSEMNTKDFVIEHSMDGKEWKVIGNVLSNNGSEKNNYNYTDALPLTGLNYYRIKQTDRDDKYSYSEVRTVRMNEDRKSFEIIGNPVTNKAVQLKINGAAQSISLFSSDGRLLWKKAFDAGQHSIDLSRAVKGIYFLKSYDHFAKLVVQ